MILVQFEVEYCDTSSSALFAQIALAIHGGF
jgi:hypothetical protein